MAVVFQQHALAPRLTSRANVLVGALGRIGFWRATLWHCPARRVAAAEDCLALAGLGQRRAGILSGGQRQRIVIAQALARHAPVLPADKPFASLDRGNTEGSLGLLRNLAGRVRLRILACLHQPTLPDASPTGTGFQARQGRPP